jgi:hypothetical protein
MNSPRFLFVVIAIKVVCELFQHNMISKACMIHLRSARISWHLLKCYSETIDDKAGRWFSLGEKKTDRHDIAEILLKVALNIIISPPPPR